MRPGHALALLCCLGVACGTGGKNPGASAPPDDGAFVAARADVAKGLADGWETLGPRLFPADDCGDVPTRAGVESIMWEGASALVKASAMPLPPVTAALAECRAATVDALAAVAKASAPWAVVPAGGAEGVMGGGDKSAFGVGGEPTALLAALRRFDAITSTCGVSGGAAVVVAAAGRCAKLPPAAP